MIKRSFALALALGLAACGGDDGSQLEGIYTLESWTVNAEGCDQEGAPSFEESLYTHFFVRYDHFFDGFVSVVMCDDLIECRERAADTETLYIGQFSFEEGNDADGWTDSSVFLSGASCDGGVTQGLLTGDPQSAVRIEERLRLVSDVAHKPDGDCDEAAARAQAEGKACDQLTVVTGAFLESI